MELPDDETAKSEAVRYAGQLLLDHPRDLWEHGQWRVEVTDEQGALRWLIVSIALDAPTADDLAESRGATAYGSL